MTEFIVLCFLLANLDVPSQDAYPSAAAFRAAAGLSESGKRAFIVKCGERPALAVPQTEDYAWDSFDGVYGVIWRRAQARPFPYPDDPTYGSRDQ